MHPLGTYWYAQMLLKEPSHPYLVPIALKSMSKAMVGTWVAFEPYPLAPNEDHRVTLAERIPEGRKV